VKALDGPYWMKGIDPSAEALGAIIDVEQHVQLAHEAGLYYFCWTNPRQFDLEIQAMLTAAIARACDGVFLDVEPYTQFWGPWAPVGTAESFVADIRLGAPDAWIAIQPDPRPNALAAIRIGEWMPYVDAISGQHYWSDFHSDATAELIHAQALGELYGKPSLPTLPGNAPYSSFPWSLISHLPGFVVWRMGTTPNATLLRLGSTPVMGLKSDKLDWSDE